MPTLFARHPARLNSLLFALLGFFAAVGVQSMTQGHSALAAPSSSVNLAALIVRLNADENMIAALKAKTAPLSVSGTDLTFTGVNVHIVSGSGSTDDGTVVPGGNPIPTKNLTGLGNLIIGYNETGKLQNVNYKGSHNLILGAANSYSGFGGLVAGYNNTIKGQYACVSGGYNNTASDGCASVSGGWRNEATGYAATVSGGNNNKAKGFYATVSGGDQNTVTATTESASISGGESNTASGSCASVSGGYGAIASGSCASVSGGVSNQASGGQAAISGGIYNKARGDGASVSGGNSVIQKANYGWSGGAYHTP